MKRYLLTWRDEVEPTYPGITVANGENHYEFEVESDEDAQAFVRSFAMINPEHNFMNNTLTEVEKED